MSLVPAMRVARSRDPTARAASADTVIAVPTDIAKVEAMPAHIKPRPFATKRTPMAPVQGRMPTASAKVSARFQDHSPCTASAVGMCA